MIEIEQIAQSWDRIDERRQLRRVTWSALSYHVGVSESTLRRWRAESASPGYEVGIRIARYLGFRPEDVFGWQYEG